MYKLPEWNYSLAVWRLNCICKHGEGVREGKEQQCKLWNMHLCFIPWIPLPFLNPTLPEGREGKKGREGEKEVEKQKPCSIFLLEQLPLQLMPLLTPGSYPASLNACEPLAVTSRSYASKMPISPGAAACCLLISEHNRHIISSLVNNSSLMLGEKKQRNYTFSSR